MARWPERKNRSSSARGQVQAQTQARPPTTDGYASLHEAFRWQIDPAFHISAVCCHRWATMPDAHARRALIDHETGETYSYAQLGAAVRALSRELERLGVRAGDRVAIVLPQRLESALAFLSVMHLGAVAMPLSQLFGPEALAYRLQDSQAVLALCDAQTRTALESVRADCPALREIVALGSVDGQALSASQRAIDAAVADPRACSSDAQPVPRGAAEDPAVLIYTSGTTGNPKGALIPHRALMGNLTGFVCSQNWLGFDPWNASQDSDAVFWSPADWAWTGGLMDALLPTLYFGRPIVACRSRFSAEKAFEILQTQGVTHTFLFPTAIKAMMKAEPHPRARWRLKLQAIMSAGESVGDAVFSWCENQLGVTVNEMFGQTEVNYIVGNCARLWPARAGSMGRAYPGHRVAVIDEAGQVCPPGVVGDVALHRCDRHGHPDPVLFMGYWRNEGATAAKFSGDWWRTGDLAQMDAEGYLWYQGRADDVFKAAGYRIGPGEIENCLVKHDAVANAAVVPKPDAERGALVKAYVVLVPDQASRRAALSGAARDDFDRALVASLQAHVRGQLAPYEYPKEIEFIDALPMTTTGKVQRRVLRLQEEARAAEAR